MTSVAHTTAPAVTLPPLTSEEVVSEVALLSKRSDVSSHTAKLICSFMGRQVWVVTPSDPTQDLTTYFVIESSRGLSVIEWPEVSRKVISSAELVTSLDGATILCRTQNGEEMVLDGTVRVSVQADGVVLAFVSVDGLIMAITSKQVVAIYDIETERFHYFIRPGDSNYCELVFEMTGFSWGTLARAAKRCVGQVRLMSVLVCVKKHVRCGTLNPSGPVIVVSEMTEFLLRQLLFHLEHHTLPALPLYGNVEKGVYGYPDVCSFTPEELYFAVSFCGLAVFELDGKVILLDSPLRSFRVSVFGRAPVGLEVKGLFSRLFGKNFKPTAELYRILELLNSLVNFYQQDPSQIWTVKQLHKLLALSKKINTVTQQTKLVTTLLDFSAAPNGRNFSKVNDHSLAKLQEFLTCDDYKTKIRSSFQSLSAPRDLVQGVEYIVGTAQDRWTASEQEIVLKDLYLKFNPRPLLDEYLSKL